VVVETLVDVQMIVVEEEKPLMIVEAFELALRKNLYHWMNFYLLLLKDLLVEEEHLRLLLFVGMIQMDQMCLMGEELMELLLAK
jgi:hypothetical protein